MKIIHLDETKIIKKKSKRLSLTGFNANKDPKNHKLQA